jgi:hypothetical protein
MATPHSRLQVSDIRFVLLGASGEDLKKPFEKEWQKTANYQHDAPKLAAHRGNYGVCGGFGDLHIIDCDDLGRWEEMGVLPLIPLTFTIESRPGHRQFYVTCKDHFKSGGLYDPEETELNEQGKPGYVHIGDLKAVGGQAVGPGCKHPSGATYTVVVDAPIAEVSREHLQSILSRFKTGPKFNTNHEEDASEAKRRKYAEKDPLDDLRVLDIMPPAGATSQSGDELRGDHPVHGSTNGGNYVINTAKNVWHCMRCKSGGGVALAIAVKHGLISCSDASAGVIRGDLFKQVLKVAREQGYITGDAKPEEPKGPTVIDAIRALKEVCDGARTKDGTGFNGYDAKTFKNIIAKAVNDGTLSQGEEKTAYKFLKKYEKQLKGFGIEYADIVLKGNDERESAATTMVKLVLQSGAELWHTPKQEFYISFERNGHRENHPTKTKAVKLWLGSLFFNNAQKTPGSQALRDALNILEATAMLDGPEHEAYVRVGPYEDRIFVDLGDDTWRAIEITKEGWKVVNEAPVRFWRPRSTLPMPEPVKGGKWEDLRKLINAKSDRSWILAVAWAAQAFWPTGPYAHHNFSGEQGTGKTLAQIIFKLLLDPSVTPLRRPPKDEKDLMIAARNERIPSFDNLSGMPEHLSDAFCGLSTGTALACRSLYTDDEEAFLAARRPCVMNGIDTLTNRGDLLDRTIINELPRIKPSDRILEKKIMAEFERVRPKLLGLFLDATSTGLSRVDEIDDSDLPRMADFCAWIIACEPSLPWKTGKFVVEYLAAIENSLATLVESDQVARAVYEMALEYGRTGKTFSGTSTELLELLNQRKHIDPNHPPKGWPRISNTLSSRLRRAAPALRAVKVKIEWGKQDRNTRLIEISLAETIQETIGDDPKERDRLQKTGSCDTRDDGDDGDDLSPFSSPLTLRKIEREEAEAKKDAEKRRMGGKIVSTVSSSPGDQPATISERRSSTCDRLRSSPDRLQSTKQQQPIEVKTKSEPATIGPHPRRDVPTPPPKKAEPARADPLRAMAITLYGMHGRVDTWSLVKALHISEGDAISRLQALDYVAYTGQNGQTYFKQRTTGTGEVKA